MNAVLVLHKRIIWWLSVHSEALFVCIAVKIPILLICLSSILNNLPNDIYTYRLIKADDNDDQKELLLEREYIYRILMSSDGTWHIAPLTDDNDQGIPNECPSLITNAPPKGGIVLLYKLFSPLLPPYTVAIFNKSAVGVEW